MSDARQDPPQVCDSPTHNQPIDPATDRFIFVKDYRADENGWEGKFCSYASLSAWVRSLSKDVIAEMDRDSTPEDGQEVRHG